MATCSWKGQVLVPSRKLYPPPQMNAKMHVAQLKIVLDMITILTTMIVGLTLILDLLTSHR